MKRCSTLRCAALILLALGFVSGAGAQLASKRSLTLDAAKSIAAAAQAEAKKNKWNMIIAIVDDGGNLLYLERMDGAQLGSIEIAQFKARTSLKFKRATKDFGDRLQAGETYLLRVPDMAPFDGGVPVIINGECIGGIGVSGATAAQDGQVARAGLAVTANWK
jgi:glc operon protein GlcG